MGPKFGRGSKLMQMLPVSLRDFTSNGKLFGVGVCWCHIMTPW